MVMLSKLVREDGKVFAAKSFYCISDTDLSPPSVDTNLQALQQEMVIMTIARSILSDFIALAAKLKVGISGTSILSFSSCNFNFNCSTVAV